MERPAFEGLRVSQDAHAAELIPGVVRVPSVDEPGLSLDPLRIHQGANSGFQALNLAVLLGARRIALLGYDMAATGGRSHWHGDHPSGLNNPTEDNFARWRTAFAGALPDLERAGVEVVNCTPGSALTCFPRSTIEEFIVSHPRHAEQEKYQRAYGLPGYRMGAGRRSDAVRDLAALPCRGAYLDVGCGRGEMLDLAEAMGFEPVQGVEVVPQLVDGERVVKGEGHRLPFADKSFDVVSLFDVIEHLLPGDDEAVCREMARVARGHVLLTANNCPSRLPDGTELHINRRAYEEWDRLFRDWFPGTVTRIEGPRSFPGSPGWRVDL